MSDTVNGGGAGDRPRDGMVVVDLTRQMSGPYASMVLGDFGADVFKVECSPRGDGARYIGSRFVGGESTMFLTWNRNKLSICVDLRAPEGKEVLNRLIDGADVVWTTGPAWLMRWALAPTKSSVAPSRVAR